MMANPAQNDLFTIAFLVMALMMAMVWRNFLIVFLHKTREMIFSRDWRTFEAENATAGSRMRIILVFVTLVSVSIFVFQINRFTPIRQLPYWSILLGITILHLIRILITKLLEFLLDIRGVFEIWFESYIWIHFMVGVLFFPLAVLMTYSPETTFSVTAYLGAGLFLLGEILLFYRLFAVFYRGLSSLFYLFLYLCTLEILPLLTVYGLLS